MSEIDWMFYPKSNSCPQHLINVINVFNSNIDKFDSSIFSYSSNEVLEELRPDLESNGYLVESGKKKDEKISVPVLFGKNGILEKSFDADAYSPNTATVIEVEAGRAVANYQFLKDLFEACVMNNVDYLVIAVRKLYIAGGRPQKDFDSVISFFDTLYSSNKLHLPLKGILIIGY